MSIYDFKPAFQNLLRPFCQKLATKGITANQVTIAALLVSIATGAFIWLSKGAGWSLALVPLVLFIRMALNAIDGMLAREHDMQTDLGAILNELGDVFSDASLYLPFSVIPGVPPSLVIGIVILAIISEMAGLLAIQVGAQRRYDGPMGKSDRAFLFGLVALLLALGIEAGAWLQILLIAANLLLLLTIANRVRKALAEKTL
jgi:CDP-diacylglycerol--glycerol-3-phosphate 3-phosphatidyltransferase